MAEDNNIKGFFAEYPEAYRLFNALKDYIETLGAMRIEAMKTQVSFGTKRKYAWVWLPQKWIKKRPKDSITLTFVLGRRITDARIEEAVEPRPGYWTHHTLIKQEEDIDNKLRDWLHEAYINSYN